MTRDESMPGHPENAAEGEPSAASQHQAGPAEGWPEELQAHLRHLSALRHAACVLWGDDLTAMPNEAWSEMASASGADGAGDLFGALPEAAELVRRAVAGAAPVSERLALRSAGTGRADRHLAFDCTPLRTAGGAIGGVWCTCRDVTREVEDAARAALRLRLTEAFLEVADGEAAIAEAARILGEHLDADTVGVSEADESGTWFTIHRDWVSERGHSVAGTHRLTDFGPEMVGDLRAGRIVAVPDIARDRMTSAFTAAFADLGFRSFVAAPVVRSGRLVGTTFALACEPRQWAAGDTALVAEVGHRLWPTVEARRAEAERSESERQLQLALRAARAGTFLVPPDGTPPVVTDGARELFGFAATAQPGVEDFVARVHPADRAAVQAAIERSLAEGTGHYLEYRIQAPDGTVRWIASRAEVEPGGAGPVLRGALIDVTDQKTAEARNAALREEAERADTLLHAVARSVDDLIFVKDTERRLRLANPAVAALMQRDPGDILGRTETELGLDPAEAAAMQANDEAVLGSGQSARFEETFTGPDGPQSWLTTKAPLRDAGGTVIGLVGVSKNITERTRAERALERERELLLAIFDSIPVMITLYDPQVNVLLLNAEFTRLTGWTTEAAAEADIMAEVYPDPEYRAAVGAFMESCEGWMEVTMRTRDGRQLATEWANVALSDSRRVGIGLDVSQRKEAERHRHSLMAELDHRVKNTLAVVQSLARQTFRGIPSAGPAVKAFTGRLRSLAAAHDLLTEANWETASLRAVAEASIAAATARRSAVTIVGPDLALSPKEAVSLAIAFHELTTNAAKHGALALEKGRVEVRWDATAGPADGGVLLDLEWCETGVGRATPPGAAGFGSRLLTSVIPRDLKGEARLDHAEGGTRWHLHAPLETA